MSRPLRRIDVHTHILPESWPDWNEKYGGDSSFVTIERAACGCKANLWKVSKVHPYLSLQPKACTGHLQHAQTDSIPALLIFSPGRQNVSCNRGQLLVAGGSHRRVQCDQCRRASPLDLPVLFNYSAKPEVCLEISQFLNNHISDICKSHPDRFIGMLVSLVAMREILDL